MALDQPTATAPPAAKTLTPLPGENPAIYENVVVYQHSSLFYWWPVWFFGFLFGAVSYFGGHHMAIVPSAGWPILPSSIASFIRNTGLA